MDNFAGYYDRLVYAVKAVCHGNWGNPNRTAGRAPIARLLLVNDRRDDLMWSNGAPDTIRTCDPLIRSQVLYPAELRVHWGRFSVAR